MQLSNSQLDLLNLEISTKSRIQLYQQTILSYFQSDQPNISTQEQQKPRWHSVANLFQPGGQVHGILRPPTLSQWESKHAKSCKTPTKFPHNLDLYVLESLILPWYGGKPKTIVKESNYFRFSSHWLIRPSYMWASGELLGFSIVLFP